MLPIPESSQDGPGVILVMAQTTLLNRRVAWANAFDLKTGQHAAGGQVVSYFIAGDRSYLNVMRDDGTIFEVATTEVRVLPDVDSAQLPLPLEEV